MNSKVSLTILEKDYINQILGVAAMLGSVNSLLSASFSPANLYGQKNNKVLKLNNYLIHMQ